MLPLVRHLRTPTAVRHLRTPIILTNHIFLDVAQLSSFSVGIVLVLGNLHHLRLQLSTGVFAVLLNG